MDTQPTPNEISTIELFTDTPDQPWCEPYRVLSVDKDTQAVIIIANRDDTHYVVSASEMVPQRLWEAARDKYAAYESAFRTAALETLLKTEMIIFPEDGDGKVTEQPYAQWAGMQGRSFGDYFGREHFTLHAVGEINADASDFLENNWSDLENLDPSQTGRDFILSRNGHDGGFSGRGYGSPEQRSRLHEAAKVYGSQGLQVNRIYQVEVHS